MEEEMKILEIEKGKGGKVGGNKRSQKEEEKEKWWAEMQQAKR